MAIAHRRIGTGPLRVIVLHDWFGTSANWGSVLDHLDPEGFSYAFLDYRGYGERRDVAGRYSLPEIADDVLELADQLGWDTFSLLGHSMGGKAVQQVLVRAPERIEKLIGLAPVGLPLRDGRPDPRPLPRRRRGPREAPDHPRPGHRQPREPPLAGPDGGPLPGGLRPEAFAAYLASWQPADLSAAVKGNTVPVLVLVGEYDLALTAEVMRATWQAWYPNCRIVTIPGSGHYPPHETPVAFATEVEAFLRA